MNRELSLDYLKVISLLGLVVAHVSSNTFLLQLRSFDVNLLVIISAILAAEGFKRNNTGEMYMSWGLEPVRTNRRKTPETPANTGYQLSIDSSGI